MFVAPSPIIFMAAPHPHGDEEGRGGDRKEGGAVSFDLICLEQL